ncbi:hypothetical protein SAMN05444483_104211 [Salegentibacter echinorum]|uniref:UbiA prenyltransferase family protein n=1 Tax=Salegentibacter echinorum TaxID=1073325 RepID=A0A1M5GL83_SALEC|nr:hypothetical protein [Salegentibacter echinorum]SHG04469.1 hypothetical protein SAMN05444483_104211 [Salegentibacter echinorum]
MQFFRCFLNFYINSSIHVAFAVVSLSLLSFLEFNLVVDFNLLLFIFLGSITGYNFVKYAGIAKLHHRSLARNLKLIQVFSLLCFLGFVYFALQQKLEILFAAAVFGIFTLLYAIPPGKNNQNLRNTSGIKIYVIALVWAGVTVIFPLLDKVELNQLILEFLQKFCFVIALTIPFEIRDLKFDAGTLKTLPQQIGVRRTKTAGYLLLAVTLFLEFWKDFVLVELIALLLIIGVTGLFVKYSKTNQQDYFASFWVEGIPVLWLLIWWGVSCFF